MQPFGIAVVRKLINRHFDDDVSGSVEAPMYASNAMSPLASTDELLKSEVYNEGILEGLSQAWKGFFGVGLFLIRVRWLSKRLPGES